MTRTKIDYLDRSWNPIIGCSPAGPSCRNCWAAGFASRGRCEAHRGLTVGARWTGEVRFLPERLDQPLKWKQPQRVGVAFMGDLFHDSVRDEWIDQIMLRIQQADRHQFFVLTKRPLRMADYFEDCAHRDLRRATAPPNKPSNLWLGVSAGTQGELDLRLSNLVHCPAPRWLSLEPLLEDVSPWPAHFIQIDWLVIGCESGSRRRHCDVRWVRHVVREAASRCMPIYVKQLDINGRVSHDPAEWPEDLRLRQLPVLGARD